MQPLEAARGVIPLRRRVRIGVTGLRRSGKTSLLTSLAVNLLAMGRGIPALPALSQRLGGRAIRVKLAASGAQSMPRFDAMAKAQALAADPPGWPQPTDSASNFSSHSAVGLDCITGVSVSVTNCRLATRAALVA